MWISAVVSTVFLYAWHTDARIVAARYGSMKDREDIRAYIQAKRRSGRFKVIDIGCPCFCCCWSEGLVDAVADLVRAEDTRLTQPGVAQKCDIEGDVFYFDFAVPESWSALISHVDAHGKYDLALCTHVVEDLPNDPRIIANLLARIAKGGFLALPSKFVELQNFEPGRPFMTPVHAWRGYAHHHWVGTLDISDGSKNATLAFVPKLPLLDRDPYFDNFPFYDGDTQFAPESAQMLYDELRLLWWGALPVRVLHYDIRKWTKDFLKDVRQLLVKPRQSSEWTMLLHGTLWWKSCIKTNGGIPNDDCPIYRPWPMVGARIWM
eukprot:TRINITY_DN17756_c0_g4_i1.p1 TRINITY_DN17756_c0_g4~~TRINITY_DN17756_c0_g4_i1.p1  ORF type:complete len:321 (-),score=17.73 TRINITY_DN17756_c0_g4_i1:174-1136(-)